MDLKALLPQIDACRPASDDLNDPELADLAAHVAADPQARELYERVQALDARIATAFQHVTPPADLADRLLARLQAAEEHVAAGDSLDEPALDHVQSPCAATPATCTDDSVMPACFTAESSGARGLETPLHGADGSRSRRRRRWLLPTGAGLAVAASLAVALAWVYSPPRYTPEKVIEDVLALHVQQFQKSGPQIQPAARTVSDGSDVPTGLPASKLLSSRARAGAGRLAEGLLGRDGAAYDLRAGRYKATLYVARQAVEGLPAKPPAHPAANTAGFAVAAWQEGGLVYVLVVRGGESEYRGFVDQPRPRVA